MVHEHAWFRMRKGEIEAFLSQVDLFQIFRALLQVVPVEQILGPSVSQNIEHLISKGRHLVLHRKVKDPDVFEREALPNALVKGHGNRAVRMGLPENPAS